MVSLEKVPLANFGVIVAEPKTIPVPGGDVRHGLSLTDDVFNGFGEAYFSNVAYGAVKAWKKHNKMCMNLVVPSGSVKFVFFLEKKGTFREEIIGENRYARLTVPPGVWFGFKGMDNTNNLILNISSILHDPKETDIRSLDEIGYEW